MARKNDVFNTSILLALSFSISFVAYKSSDKEALQVNTFSAILYIFHLIFF